MSIVTTGQGAAGTSAGKRKKRPAAGVSTAEPATEASPAEPPVEEPSREPSGATRTIDPPYPNGHAPHGGSAARTDGDPAERTDDGPAEQTDDSPVARGDGVKVVVRPRPHPRLHAFRWPALILLALLLVGAGAKAGSMVADRMPTKYAAHADVLYPLVQEQPTGFLRQDRNLSTQEVLLASRTILDPVAAQFGIPVEDLIDELTTEVVEESEVIRVQFTDPSRAQARKVLVAILARYIEISNNPARTEVRAYLDAQLADVRARLVTAREEAEDVDSLGLSQAAQAQVDALVTREAALLAQIDEEQFALIAGPVPQISVPPYIEQEPVSPQPLLATAGGALAGLVVALIVVAVLARRMTRP